MEIYRYTIKAYLVPVEWYNENGDLSGKDMVDVERNCELVVVKEISANYNEPKSVKKIMFENYILKHNLNDFKLEQTGSAERQTLDAFDKNLEFCDKAEMNNPHLEGKYKDVWEYLEWCCGSTMLAEEFRELVEAIQNKDEVETIDGACDVAVIALNIPCKLLVKKGFTLEEAKERTRIAFERVTDSNLSKLKNDKGFHAEFAEDGKVLKGGAFSKPIFDDLLALPEGREKNIK